jgi:hypothetical protein
LSIEDLADRQGELAISIEFNHSTDMLAIGACAPLPENTKPADIAAAYLSLCDSDEPSLQSFFYANSVKQAPTSPKPKEQAYTILNAKPPLATYAGKKYKPVGLKVRPVETELPSRFRITRDIKGDPLKDMPNLPTRPSAYAPTGRYTEERKAVIDKAHPGNFLLPEERALMHNLMSLQNEGFASSGKNN